jgi:hypothetical protein
MTAVYYAVQPVQTREQGLQYEGILSGAAGDPVHLCVRVGCSGMHRVPGYRCVRAHGQWFQCSVWHSMPGSLSSGFWQVRLECGTEQI